MIRKSEYFEQTDKYLNSELTLPELKEFEIQLEIDSNLNEEVNLHLDVEQAMGEQDIISLRNTLNQIVQNQTESAYNENISVFDSFSFGLSEEFSSRKSSNAQNISDDVLGSQAYIAVPRVAWGTKRRDSDNTCVVAIIKNNLAPLIGGYEYTIESHTVLNDLGQEIETSRIVWGEYRAETASQLFKDFASDNADDTESLTEPSKLLIDLLKDGSSIKVSDIKRMVDEHPSISWRSVERAGTALKVVRQRTNTFPSETYWCLPPISPHLVKPNQACA